LLDADTRHALPHFTQEPPAHALWSGRLDASSFGLPVAHVARVVAALRTLQRACVSAASSDGNDEAWPAARDTLASVLGNVVSAPAAPKFRTLRTRNAALRARLLRHDGARALLREVGFVPFTSAAPGVPPADVAAAEQEEVLCLPMEASLAAARAALARVTAAQTLTDDLPKGGSGSASASGGAGESAEEAAARRCVSMSAFACVHARRCFALTRALRCVVLLPRVCPFVGGWQLPKGGAPLRVLRGAHRGRQRARLDGTVRAPEAACTHKTACTRKNPIPRSLTQRPSRRWDAPAGQYRYACATCAAPASLCEACHDRYTSGAPGVHAPGHSFTPHPPITSRLAASGASGGGAASDANPWGNFGASVSARSRQRLKERSGM
jgi:hypothetical protein